MTRSIPSRLLCAGSRLGLGLAALLALTLTLGACSDDGGDNQNQNQNQNPDAAGPAVLHHVTPAELNGWLAQKDFLLINVHIPNAGEITGTDTHIAYTDTDALAAYIGADLNTKAVLYCLTDHMTDIAGPALVDRGYREIYVLDGGMNGWTAAGYTLDP